MEEVGRGLEHISEILPRVFSNDFVTECRESCEPPYDSPIEATFAEHCLKHLSPNVHAEKQVEANTKHGSFRVDFALSTANRRIAVECDGRDFHEGLRDELRDAILLGEEHFDTVYHFRGCDIVCYPNDCVSLMSLLDSELFSERGRLNLDRLRHLEISDSAEELSKRESFSCLIWDETKRYHFWAFRRSLKMILDFPHLRYHWKVLYDFACKNRSASLDELLDMR